MRGERRDIDAREEKESDIRPGVGGWEPQGRHDIQSDSRDKQSRRPSQSRPSQDNGKSQRY